MDNEQLDQAIGDIKKRQSEISGILLDIRNVYTGLHTPLNQLIMKRRRIDITSVDNVVAELLHYTECGDEMKNFYAELYKTAILYLYAQGFRPSDMIILSIWKIAATFHLDSTRRYFENTPFGIMLSDLWEKPEMAKQRRTSDDRIVYDVLKEHASRLEEVYNAIKGRFAADNTTRNALEIYAATHGWGCLNDPVLYDKVRSNIVSSRLDAQYEMRKGSENDGFK